MLTALPPRAFIDFTVPQRLDGSLLTRCESEADFLTYLRWISEYLHTVELPLTPDQEAWLLDLKPSPSEIVLDCADTFAHSLRDLEVLKGHLAVYHTYPEFRAGRYQIYYEHFSEFDRRMAGPFEHFGLNAPLFERYQRERRQEIDSGQEWVFFDIPFRPLLAWALHQIPSPAARYCLMSAYFEMFKVNVMV